MGISRMNIASNSFSAIRASRAAFARCKISSHNMPSPSQKFTVIVQLSFVCSYRFAQHDFVLAAPNFATGTIKRVQFGKLFFNQLHVLSDLKTLLSKSIPSSYHKTTSHQLTLS